MLTAVTLSTHGHGNGRQTNNGEQCCAGEGSTGKQGRRLLLSSFLSALQMGICTNMEPEQDTHLPSALHLVSMAHRTDKSASNSALIGMLAPPQDPLALTSTFDTALLSPGPNAAAGIRPADCSGRVNVALLTQ